MACILILLLSRLETYSELQVTAISNWQKKHAPKILKKSFGPTGIRTLYVMSVALSTGL